MNQTILNTRTSLRRKGGWKLAAVVIILSAIGLTDTGFLTYNQFFQQGVCQTLPLGISFLGNDCGTVTNSVYGVLLGFPLQIWGSIGYALVFFFTLSGLFRKSYLWVTLVVSGSGTIISWGLLGVQHYLLEAYCPLCILSLIIMTLILVTTLAGMVSYQPQFLTGAQSLISLLLAGLISTTILLTYKIFEDSFSPPPASETASLSSTNPSIAQDFPAGVVEEKIIYLKDIDEFLKANLSRDHWNTLITSPKNYAGIWEEIRRRALYLLAMEYQAEIKGGEFVSILSESLGTSPEDIEKLQESLQEPLQESLDSLTHDNNQKTRDKLIQYFLSVEPMIQAVDNQDLISPDSMDGENLQKVIDYLKKQITVVDNIPPIL